MIEMCFKKLKIKNLFVATALINLFNFCALPSSPTGGPRDTTAPKVVDVVPKIGKTNFSNQEQVKITFDEYVKIDNPSNILITPFVNKEDVRVVAKKNIVTISFKKPLASNTTYQVNFSNAIKDVNESNPIGDFTYIFSTGEKLDSLKLTGQLNLIGMDKIPANTYVLLYDIEDTSGFTSGKPLYFSKITNNGMFSFNHMRSDSFRVFALSDKNNNLFFDLPTEEIGFIKEPVFINRTTAPLEIPLFVPHEANYRIVDYDGKISDNRISLTLNKNVYSAEQILVESMDGFSRPIVYDFNYLKEIDVFFGETLDSVSRVDLKITVGENVIDTISVFKHETTEGLAFLKPTLKNDKLLKIDTLYALFKAPVEYIVEENVFVVDLNSGDSIVPLQIFTEYENNVGFFSEHSSFSDAGIKRIVFLDSFAHTSTKETNDSVNLEFTIEEPTLRGNLKLTYVLTDTLSNYIVNVYSSDYQYNKYHYIEKDFNFFIEYKNMRPGAYKVKIIKDKNKNRLWDSGSINGYKFPEEIYIHDKTFTIRPNWETEEEIRF